MRKFVPALVLALAAAGPAHATVGGPTLCEVLGLDEAARRVWFTLTSRDETGEPPRLFYFDLGGATPARPVGVPRPRTADLVAANRVRAEELAALRARLRPLAEAPPWTSFLPTRAPAPFDSVRFEGGRRARWVVEVFADENGGGTRPRMLTLDPSPHAVRELRRWRLPGEARWLAVWSAELDPWEGGYEIQLPVILGDRRGRPDPIAPEAYATPR